MNTTPSASSPKFKQRPKSESVQAWLEFNRKFESEGKTSTDPEADALKESFYHAVVPVVEAVWGSMTLAIAKARVSDDVPFIISKKNNLDSVFQETGRAWLEATAPTLRPDVTDTDYVGRLKEHLTATALTAIYETLNFSPSITDELLQFAQQYFQCTRRDTKAVLATQLLSGFNSGVNVVLDPVIDLMRAAARTAQDNSSPIQEDAQDLLRDNDVILHEVHRIATDYSTLTSLHLSLFGPYHDINRNGGSDQYQTLVVNDFGAEMMPDRTRLKAMLDRELTDEDKKPKAGKKVCPFAHAKVEVKPGEFQPAMVEFLEWIEEVANLYLVPYLQAYYLENPPSESVSLQTAP